jgi:hypothetical protein
MRKKAQLVNEINTIQAGLTMKRLRMVDAENVMKEFDLTDKTIDQIDQTLKVKRTKLNLFMANMEREGKETAKK